MGLPNSLCCIKEDANQESDEMKRKQKRSSLRLHLPLRKSTPKHTHSMCNVSLFLYAFSSPISFYLIPLHVHPMAEDVDEHEQQKHVCIGALLVQSGQHQQQTSRGATVGHHVQHSTERRRCFVVVVIVVSFRCLHRGKQESEGRTQNKHDRMKGTEDTYGCFKKQKKARTSKEPRERSKGGVLMTLHAIVIRPLTRGSAEGGLTS